MPSVHPCTEVRKATRRTGDKEEVVVKVRGKRGSFVGRSEEKAFRASTEALLNLPASSCVARLYEAFEDEAAYYIVMEKVGGMDLYETLRKKGLPSVEEVRGILHQLLQGVETLHANGLIHRDLKLENVMIDLRRRCMPAELPESPKSAPGDGKAGTPPNPSRSGSVPAGSFRGTVKLIDFDTVELCSGRAIESREVLGTNHYIAPESYEGRYSPASDIFSVGVIAYRLLTGKFPFRGVNFDDKPGENWVGSPRMASIKGRLEDEKLEWNFPAFTFCPGLQQLIAGMLATGEHQRPSAAEALADDWFSLREISAQSRRHVAETHWLLPHCVDDDN